MVFLTCSKGRWFSSSPPLKKLGSHGLMFNFNLFFFNFSRQELPNECEVTGGSDPQNNCVDFVGYYFEVALLAFPIIRQHLPPFQNNFQNYFAGRGLV